VFILIPYHVDVPMRCRPWANWVLIGLTVLFYPLCISGDDLSDLGKQLMLGSENPIGYVGHVLVHAGLFHLLGNMLFLWVFGNAVCSKLGNLRCLGLYFGLALCVGVISYALDPRPAVGASGVINGVVGMFLVWYVVNEISCWYAWWLFVGGRTGTLHVRSFWMILLWLVFDVIGLLIRGGNIGYVAHLTGFALGFGLAVFLLRMKWVEMDEGERSLLDLFAGESPKPAARSSARPASRVTRRRR
jgi:membrane associated rhomboid family serine protease